MSDDPNSIKYAKPLAGIAVALLITGTLYLCIPHLSHRLASKPAVKPYKKPDLGDYVATHAGSLDPVVQDKVGEARMRLAYAQADESWKSPKDTSKKVAAFEAARQTFLAAAKTKGQRKADPNFGTIADQAAYQAAVCLVAENKPQQAKKEFAGFMKQRPLSPLCKACYDRLARLNGGKRAPENDALYQADVRAQEKQVRFETSVCGPKAIAAILPMLGKPAKSYQELAKLCGTTDSGTTVEGMRKGLRSLGIQSYAFQLNAADFDRLRGPVVLLRGNHYLIVREFKDNQAEAYDPTSGETAKTKLPKSNDADFSATVIVFSHPTISLP